MDTSANLALPYLAPQQAQKHVIHNEALRMLDTVVQLGVISRTVAAPPAEPAEGDRYIIGAAASDAWAGLDGMIAAFQDGTWFIHQPREGWLAWVADEDALLARDASGEWIIAGIRSGVPLFGVNTEANATNRFAVKSDAVTFSHDDVTPGSGDQRMIVNKESATGTASLVFQTGWSGRAELGTTGDDRLCVKVSADGAVWREALKVENDTGRVSFPSGGPRETLFEGRTYYVDSTTGSDSNDGLTGGTAFATLQKAVDTVLGLDFGTHDVTIQLADGAYSAGSEFGGGWLGSGTLTIRGNAGDPSAVTIAATNADCIRNSGSLPAILMVRDLTLTTGGSGMCIANEGSGQISFTNLILGDCAQYHLYASSPAAIVRAAGNYSISGDAQRHADARYGGFVNLSGRTVTFLADTAFGYQFAQAFILGTIIANGMTFSYGPYTATGERYAVSMNSALYTAAGATYLPGNAAGVASTGGQYA